MDRHGSVQFYESIENDIKSKIPELTTAMVTAPPRSTLCGPASQVLARGYTRSRNILYRRIINLRDQMQC